MLKYINEHRGFIISAVVFILIVYVSVNGLALLNRQNNEKQLILVQHAVYRAAATCYATEGFYPADVEYLKDRYGLTWDDNHYIIHYDCFASNILPEIYVLDKGDE